MDIKEKIEELAEKIKSSPDLLESFKNDPEKTIESIIGKDIPDGFMDKIIDGIKAKISGDKLGGALNKIKGLFN